MGEITTNGRILRSHLKKYNGIITGMTDCYQAIIYVQNGHCSIKDSKYMFNHTTQAHPHFNILPL